MGLNVTIRGTESIRRSLMAIGDKAPKVLEDAMDEGGRIMKQRIITNLHRRFRTGASAKGLFINKTREGTTVRVTVNSPPRATLAKNNPNFDVRDRGYYPAHQELGTKRIRPLKAYRRAFEETQAIVQQLIRDKVAETFARITA